MKHHYFISVLSGFIIFFCGIAHAQLVSDNAFLQGQFLEVCIAPNGSWGETVPAPTGYHLHTDGSEPSGYLDPVTGISMPPPIMDFNYDYMHDGWVGAFGSYAPPWYGPYYMPGTPYDGWAMQVNGVMSTAWYTDAGYNNTLGGGGTLAGTVTGYTNSGGIMTGTWTGSAGVGSALQITETNRIDTTADWCVVTVKFVNTSGSTMPGLYYFVSADPDNDKTDESGTYSTDNYIAYQGDYYNRHEVIAHPASDGHPSCISGLATKDCRAKALIYVSWPPSHSLDNDLDLVWSETATGMSTCTYGLGGFTTDQDIAYGLIYNLGDIGAGDSSILSFAWIFSDTSDIDSAFPAPQIVTQGTAYDSLDTVNGCSLLTTTFTANLIHASDKDWSWSTWTWAPATGLSATTGVSVTINLSALAGPTSYTITGTDTTAGSMLDCHAKVLYLYVIPCFSAANNGPICESDTLRLNALGDSTGDTYYWYGPGGYTAFTKRAKRWGMTMADTGLYYVVRTTSSGDHDTVKTDVVLKPLPVVTATSNAPICSGNTLSLSASRDSVDETYTWTGPNGFNSLFQNPSVGLIPTQGSGIYKVYTLLNGCTDSGFVVVVVDSTPAAPAMSNNSPLCSQRSPALMLTSGDATPGVSYSWSGPLGFTSSFQNPTISNLFTALSGIYTATVYITYDGLVCPNSNFTTVTIDSTPVLPFDSASTVVCSGTPLYLFASDTTGSLYNWIGPDGFTSNVQNPVINPAITAYTGTYSVAATYVYTIPSVIGCISDTATIYAVVDSTPNNPFATSNSPGTPSICQGDTLWLYGSDTTSPVTYTWTGPAGYNSTDQNATIINVQPSVTGVFTLTAVYDGMASCASSAVTTVSITPTPALTASSNSPVCTGTWDTLFLKAVSEPGATFSWTGPYVFRSLVQNPYRDPAIMEYGGIYQVTAFLNGCPSAIVNDTVVMNQTPPAPWVKWLTYCQNYGGVPELQATGDSILWYTTSAANAVGTLTPPIPSTSAVGNTFYYATQTLNGCTGAVDSIQVSVFPAPSVAVTHDTDLCPNDSVLLAATDVDAIAYYHWAPSLYLSDTSGATTLVRPETNVTYTVVASNQFGCTDTATVRVNVLAAAVLYLGDSVLLYPGQTYQITPQTNCTSFMWFPPTGLDNAYISDPVASPQLSTKYIVYGTTSWGCMAEDSINVYVTNQSLLAVPNAFTPGTGPNNLFKIILQGEATLNDFTVFDRWGVKVFETSNINEGWDGTLNGTPQPQGVYIYQINAVSGTGQTFVKTGNVTLLR